MRSAPLSEMIELVQPQRKDSNDVCCLVCLLALPGPAFALWHVLPWVIGPPTLTLVARLQPGLLCVLVMSIGIGRAQWQSTRCPALALVSGASAARPGYVNWHRQGSMAEHPLPGARPGKRGQRCSSW
jgi:hypothetical protein